MLRRDGVGARRSRRGADPSVRCGLARWGGRVVGFSAQTGAATRPAGFRTITRLLRLADRLQIPVLTLIDEPHDAGTASAEQEALGPAVAETLIAVAGLRVPVTSLVVGRAAGVGAIALANRGQTWMVPGRTVEIAVRDDDVVGVLSLSAAHLKSTGYASGVVA